MLNVEIRAAAILIRELYRGVKPDMTPLNIYTLLTPPLTPSKESIETLSALEIAEQMTYLDHRIFVNIRSE